MKIPVMIVGTPLRTSSTKRTRRRSAVRELGGVDRDQQPDRDRDQGRQPDQYPGADDRVGDPAAALAEQLAWSAS